MALISCSECKKEISDKAQTCPNCGFSLPVFENKNNTTSSTSFSMPKNTAAILGFIIGFTLLYVGCGASSKDFVKPSSLIFGVIVGTFFAILSVLLFGKNNK